MILRELARPWMVTFLPTLPMPLSGIRASKQTDKIPFPSSSSTPVDWLCQGGGQGMDSGLNWTIGSGRGGQGPCKCSYVVSCHHKRTPISRTNNQLDSISSLSQFDVVLNGFERFGKTFWMDLISWDRCGGSGGNGSVYLLSLQTRENVKQTVQRERLDLVVYALFCSRMALLCWHRAI